MAVQASLSYEQREAKRASGSDREDIEDGA